MKINKFLILILIAINMIVFVGCEDKNQDSNPDYEFLKGTWVEKESYALQFIDFYSEDQARFGSYSKNFENYYPFNYRIINSNQITIDWIGDDDTNETYHDLIKYGNDRIEISDLTVIPENPNTIYLRRDIITEKSNDTIIIGHNDIYFDFDNHFRLEIDSILNDSRGQTGGEYFGEGNAVVSFDLIIGGNYKHNLILNTHSNFMTDTLIDNLNFKLVGLIPHPELNEVIENNDYIAKIIVEKK